MWSCSLNTSLPLPVATTLSKNRSTGLALVTLAATQLIGGHMLWLVRKIYEALKSESRKGDFVGLVQKDVEDIKNRLK